MKENKQGIGTKIKIWWQKSSLVSRFGIVIVIAAILILFVPRGIKGEKGNLLGLTPNRIEQKNKDQYSAEPINPDKHLHKESKVAKPTVDKLNPKDVKATADGFSVPSNDELESLYEEQKKEQKKHPSNSNSSNSSSDDSSSESQNRESADNNEGAHSEGTSSTDGETYTVQAGDNLYRIAANNGMTLDELMALNGMSEPYIAPGMTIRIQ